MLVTAATEVTFLLKVVLKQSRRLERSSGSFGTTAMPALLTRTCGGSTLISGRGLRRVGNLLSSLPYFFSIPLFAAKMLALSVTSKTTTSRLEVTPSFLSSSTAASPDDWDRQARMYVAFGSRRAVD